jgi:hypothetical protein
MEPSRTQEQAEERHHGIRMLAKTLLRELLLSGYSATHVVRLASELLGLLTESIRGSSDRQAAAESGAEVSI